MFVPLHVKSDRSIGYGASSVEDLLEAAAVYGYPALALTDLETLGAQPRLHHAAGRFGVRAIVGVELRRGMAGRRPWPAGIPESKAGRLVLLARDRDGYESLCRIVTRRRAGPLGAPLLDPVTCLEQSPRGVFYLSDDANVLERLRRAGASPDDLRFLWIRPGGSEPPRGVGVVADTDAVMAHPTDRDLHALLTAIHQRSTVSASPGIEQRERSLLAPGALRERFRDHPEALTETLRVADACVFDLRDLRPAPPALAPEPHRDSWELEREVAIRLARGREQGRWCGPEYDARLARELEVVRSLGWAGALRIAARVGERAERSGFAIAARGSAAGSLLIHVLGLGAIDPIEHGLLFERFLHASGDRLPDVDLDLPSERRDAVIRWLVRRLGSERVALLSSTLTFRRRSAFREGLKALGMPREEVERFCEAIPDEELDEAAVPVPVERLPPPYRSGARVVWRLIGKARGLAAHPGGVVVTDRMERLAPLERAPKGALVTQYDAAALERLGQMKLDLLGNRALSAHARAFRILGHRLEAADGDEATLRTLREGRTLGCFQIESPLVRSTLRRFPVRGLGDLAAALAIVRPGPAAGRARAAFLRRARGEEPIHSPLSGRLSLPPENRGLLLYEEDLVMAIRQLTGLSLERADAMRAAIADAGDDEESLGELEARLKAAARAQGVSSADAGAAWTALRRFAAYSFNKAHALSYARIAWEAAALKTHEPAAFASGVLDHHGGHYPLRTVAAAFAREGLELRAPHVLRSGEATAPEGRAVRIGLGALKGSSRRSLEATLALRPFADAWDWIERVQPKLSELRAMVLAGALDGLDPLDPDAYPFAHADLLERVRAGEGRNEWARKPHRRPGGLRARTYQSLVRVQNELAFLGMHPSAHPMAVLREEARAAGAIAMEDLERHIGEPVRVGAIVAASRRLAPSAGRVLQLVTFEDETGLVEATLAPGVLAALGDPVRSPGPFLVSGRVLEDQADPLLQVREVVPFHRRPVPYGRSAAAAHAEQA